MLSQYKQEYITTSRLRTAYYRGGQENKKKLLLIHGNMSSSVFFLPLLPQLSQNFDTLIPDLRCFGNSESLPIDATKGFREWTRDLVEVTDALGWEEFSILGWSLGGGVAMQFAMDYSDRVEKLVLLAPCPPCGFGGTIGEEGTPIQPVGLGSGAGSANKQMLMVTAAQSKEVLSGLLHSFCFSTDFHLDPKIEDMLIEGLTSMKLDDQMYPGDYYYTVHWPHVLAGDHGVLNTMSPKHVNMKPLLELAKKPDILWIHGLNDVIVSDYSILDFGHLGSMGMVPGWPGMKVFPPQPMISQTRHFLNLYEEHGGHYHESIMPGGHACHLEGQEHFVYTLKSFLES
ncbi:MAG: alpha/beta hydrolase [Spirochaetaceae bacterium]|nr:alpha/beta hydrolase [Spirochaetaceae bacterium]